MTSPMAARVPGAAFDTFMAGAAPASRTQRNWEPADGPMPALYLATKAS